MDSNNLTIAVTIFVALITGLLAYTSALSAKEKEVKLSVYEKLGIDLHAALESLQNNTEYLIQIILFSEKTNRQALLDANKKVPADLSKLRELNVRVMFFDIKLFKKYDETLKKHGTLTPRLFGLGSSSGTKPINPNKYLTTYEKKRYIFELEKTLSLIEETKETLIAETSKRYDNTLNSSRSINKVIYALVIIILLVVVFLPTKKEEEKKSSTTNIYILR